MNINVIYDQPTSSLPSGFVSAVNYVVNFYDSIFPTPVTVNIEVGYGEINGSVLTAGALGENLTKYISEPYSAVVLALQAHESSGLQSAAFATLPATQPLSSGTTTGTIWLTTAQAKSLGFVISQSIDAWAGFDSTASWNYSTSGTPASGEFDFVGTVEHEFSEVLGRVSLLGKSLGGTLSDSVMDLFRYSAPGVRELTPLASSAYFSFDAGTTNYADWNIITTGDLGDWANNMGPDSYLAFTGPGSTDSVTSIDLANVSLLGWPTANNFVLNQTSAISSGQTVASDGVLSGGILMVSSGGNANAATVAAGGTETLFGSASGTMVSRGGTMVASSGGVANATTVWSGGTLTVVAGGSVVSTIVSNGVASPSGGGTLIVSSGGIANIATIWLSGIEVVSVGGSAISTTISMGGLEAVSSGGIYSSTIVQSGGTLRLIGGAVLAGASATVSSGGTLAAGAGFTLGGTFTTAGEVVQIQSSGGYSGLVVSSGVSAVLMGGAVSSGTLTISSGATLAAGSVTCSPSFTRRLVESVPLLLWLLMEQGGGARSPRSSAASRPLALRDSCA
jgi:autotransporter passenger strand-loop-strand repeat protein